MAMTPRELLELDLLMEVDAFRAEHGGSTAVALSEVVTRNPRYAGVAGSVTDADVERDGASADSAELVTIMRLYSEEHNCSLAVALSEVTKLNPQLWKRHGENVMQESPAERTIIPLD